MDLPLTAYFPFEITEKSGLSRDYQGMQIFSWIHKGCFQFSGMTNLGKELRATLDKQWVVLSSAIDQAWEDDDGTVKLRINLQDGNAVETVLLADRNQRKTICLSSQVGCKMGCKYCRTGQMHFIRSLAAHEIVEQFLLAKQKYGTISHIVFMGMGEPLDNLEGIRRAVQLLNHPGGTEIGLRKITLSTCGILDGIKDLMEAGPDVKLAISLVSAIQEVREKVMPIAAKNPLPALKQLLVEYQAKSKKRVTLEIILLKGINDNERELDAIVHFIPPLKAVVNLIPWNPFDGSAFERPDNRRIAWFKQALEAKGINVTQRFRRGTGINAACGQLYYNKNSGNAQQHDL